MHCLTKSKRFDELLQVPWKFRVITSSASNSTYPQHFSKETLLDVENLTRKINDHPFPDRSLYPDLFNQIPPTALSTTFVENVLGRLFAAHSNGLKAYEFFRFSLQHARTCPSVDAFEKTLHILTRMRYFEKAWELIEEIQQAHPEMLTLKAMSIMLSRIAKFLSYEDTIEAFERMEKDIFSWKKFGISEFNVLLQAFCMQRQMKEARSVFNKMHSRFSPNTKTMNILLLGFKESGDTTAVELFYHEMVRRGFTPNIVTYNIRIDAYCKKGYFGYGLRLLEEMECRSCTPSLQTITTLIHGAGLARNITKAKQLFNEISRRSLTPDIGCYNALISSFIRSRDVEAAASLMDEMEEKGIGHDNVTYHTMFLGLMRLKQADRMHELYQKMIRRNFVPKTRTVVMLMKFFCQNQQVDMGLNLWAYMVKRGHCPHSHALDLLLTGLCSRRRIKEAFECSKQLLVRGRNMSEMASLMLRRVLLHLGEEDKWKELDQMTKRLQRVLPSKGECWSDVIYV